MASYFSNKPLELIRCEKKTAQNISPAFPYDLPELGRTDSSNIRDRSEEVANLTVDPTNPRFASTFVNRLWKRYFGLGLYELVDDFRDDTPASAPNLLAWLADDFILSGYDIKHTFRQILTRKTYQMKYNPQHADIFNAGDPGVP